MNSETAQSVLALTSVIVIPTLLVSIDPVVVGVAA